VIGLDSLLHVSEVSAGRYPAANGRCLLLYFYRYISIYSQKVEVRVEGSFNIEYASNALNVNSHYTVLCQHGQLEARLLRPAYLILSTKSMPRLSHAEALLGPEVFRQVRETKILVVGAGGIGCELCKLGVIMNQLPLDAKRVCQRDRNDSSYLASMRV
jgi:hypothetical protein